jgi:hypothetical protein
VFPDKWMSDVYLAITFQALRRMASSVERKSLCAAAEKSNAAQVADTDEKIQIQRECFDAGKPPTATPVRIAEFDLVRGAGDEFAQLLTRK